MRPPLSKELWLGKSSDDSASSSSENTEKDVVEAGDPNDLRFAQWNGKERRYGVCFDTCVSEQRLCILSPLCAHGACARTLWVVVDPLTVLEKPLCRLMLFSCREHVSRACSLTTACCFTRY